MTPFDSNERLVDSTERGYVKLGFAVPVSGSWATPRNQVDVARLAEQLGYSSLWTFQRRGD
ncbi:hypothetical protein BH23ACT12_BH23ACT12_20380 [soil metagenome]